MHGIWQKIFCKICKRIITKRDMHCKWISNRNRYHSTYKFNGSTITAKHARLQGKEVFCIPNKLDEPAGYSTNWLIQNGANLVMEPDDILQYYKIQENISVPKEYEEIYNLVNIQPISANEICKITGKKISEIMQILFMLELDGYIKCVAGNKYIKKE